MKIKFWCDNGANVHSERSETFDLEEFGVTEKEWKKMSEKGRDKLMNSAAEEWALERFEYGYEVVE